MEYTRYPLSDGSSSVAVMDEMTDVPTLVHCTVIHNIIGVWIADVENARHENARQ